MLLVKPLILKCKHGGKKAKKAAYHAGTDEEGEEGESTVLYQKMEEPIDSEVDAEEEEF